MLPNEIFLPIADVAAEAVLPYYMISNYGRIWNIFAKKFMATSWDGPGYRIAVLRTYKGSRTFRVHRLLMLTHRYFPGCEKMCVNHINGIKTANYVGFPGVPDNLEFCTWSENEIHAMRTGLKKPAFGENHGGATITNEQCRQICEYFVNGFNTKQVSDILGISLNICEMIHARRTWKSISKDYDF